MGYFSPIFKDLIWHFYTSLKLYFNCNENKTYEGRLGLRLVERGWRGADDDRGLGISSQRLLKNSGQFGVSENEIHINETVRFLFLKILFYGDKLVRLKIKIFFLSLIS